MRQTRSDPANMLSKTEPDPWEPEKYPTNSQSDERKGLIGKG